MLHVGDATVEKTRQRLAVIFRYCIPPAYNANARSRIRMEPMVHARSSIMSCTAYKYHMTPSLCAPHFPSTCFHDEDVVLQCYIVDIAA